MSTMQTVTSADGTRIAYDATGTGEDVAVLIGGAFSHRAESHMMKLAETLAEQYGLTVVNYDRRGRGESDDTPASYDPRREIEDLAAVVEATGGRAFLVGWSSGVVLALRAAGSGRIEGIEKVVAFEPPFVTNREHHVPPGDLTQRLHGLVAAGKHSETVKYFMTSAMGVPRFVVATMRPFPFWKELTATASSTPHDWALMGEYMRGEPLRPDDWQGVQASTLVVAGAKSEPLLRTGARAAADALPNATHVEVPKLSHNPKVSLLAPVIGQFLVGADTNLGG